MTESIDERIDRVEAIIERLESEDVSLAEAKELRDEAAEQLTALETELNVGDGTVTELGE